MYRNMKSPLHFEDTGTTSVGKIGLYVFEKGFIIVIGCAENVFY